MNLTDEKLEEIIKQHYSITMDHGAVGNVSVMPFIDVKSCMKAAIEADREERELEKASQQFTGFSYGKEGYSVEGLIESMGLTKQEWECLKSEEAISLSERDFEYVEEYFNQIPEAPND